MTAKEQILKFLQENSDKAHRSTDIGMACGRPYVGASSWAHTALRRLISEGKVVKEGKKYKLSSGRIHLIAEHTDGKVVLRGVVNNNLIITDPKICTVIALKQFAILAKNAEKIDIWTQEFEVTHEWTDTTN